MPFCKHHDTCPTSFLTLFTQQMSTTLHFTIRPGSLLSLPELGLFRAPPGDHKHIMMGSGSNKPLRFGTPFYFPRQQTPPCRFICRKNDVVEGYVFDAISGRLCAFGIGGHLLALITLSPYCSLNAITLSLIILALQFFLSTSLLLSSKLRLMTKRYLDHL